jgi:hypothetical protein
VAEGPRHIEVPSTEDFSAAVDLLSDHPLVDEKSVGGLAFAEVVATRSACMKSVVGADRDSAKRVSYE